MTDKTVVVNSGGGCLGCVGLILMIVVLAMLLGWMDPPSWLLK